MWKILFLANQTISLKYMNVKILTLSKKNILSYLVSVVIKVARCIQ